MHKSMRTRYKLGLFVTTSLLAIILATPLGSMSIFSDATVQEYEYDDEHQIAINRLTNYNFIAVGDWYVMRKQKRQ